MFVTGLVNLYTRDIETGLHDGAERVAVALPRIGTLSNPVELR